MLRTVAEIYDAIDVAEIKPYRLDLTYIDYRDGLRPEQVEEVLRQGWSEDVEEWTGGAQWDGACDLADELFREEATDSEFEALEEQWTESDERTDLIVTLQEMDRSDPYGDLLRNSGQMLFRVSPDEDQMPFLSDELSEPFLACEALGLGPEFLEAVTEIVPEIEGYRAEGGAHFGATWVFSANPNDLRLFPEGSRVDVTDPFLWLCNPWAGNGYGVQVKGVTVALNFDDIHVDSKAWGYSADETFGGLLLDDSTITLHEEED